MYDFDESDFPKTEPAQQACREIVSDLKGIDKALQLGLSYNKFSDLVTDTALSVEKIKNLRGEGIPRTFLSHVDDCVDAYNESKTWWSKKIDNADYPSLHALEDYDIRDYATLHLICCSGIAESNTNVTAQLIATMAEKIKVQQDAVKDGVLEAKGNFDPNVSGLTVEQISYRLNASLSVTNSPASN